MRGQLSLHPESRESDAHDMQFVMRSLRLLGSKNPYDANSESPEERELYEQWQRDLQTAWRVGRQTVRFTLEDAERYAAYRVEQEVAGTDYLSGMLNRRGFVRNLQNVYHITENPVRTSATGEHFPPVHLTFLYADLNDFKWINDNLGHHIGDRVIAETAARASAFYRRSENPLIIREGGDEFGTVLGDLDVNQAEALAQQLVNWQIDKAMSRSYREAIGAINEKLRQLKESGEPVRTETRPGKLSKEDIDIGVKTSHTLYINDEPICPLYDIVTMSTGAKFGPVNNLQDVERLRLSAEEAMDGAKQVFRRILGTGRQID